jgi:uncharacterized LabA/DUF88 family protein
MRVMVFIDGSNLFGACRDLSFKIDLEKLVSELVGGRDLIRPCYYCSIPEIPSQGTLDFIRSLKFLGFKVVQKTLKKRYDENGKEYFVEKGIDVALVIDMLSMAYKNAYDVAVLVAGDGDYVGVAEEVRSLGKRVEIAFFENNPNSSTSMIASDLRMTTDQFISLDSIKGKIKR